MREWYATTAINTPTLRSHAYGLLHTILGQAIRDALLRSNPCHIRGAENAKRTKKIKPATLPELEKLTAAMPERYRAMVLLASWCGMRFGELAELRRGDVDVQFGVIRVRRGVVRAGGEVIVKKPKSDAGVQDIAIPPHLTPPQDTEHTSGVLMVDLVSAQAVPDQPSQRGNQQQCDHADREQLGVRRDERDPAEVEAHAEQPGGPVDGTRDVVDGEPPPRHSGDADHRCEGTDHGPEARQDHRLGSVLCEERLGAFRVVTGEEPRLGAAEHPRSETASEDVPQLIAGHRSEQQAHRDQPERELEEAAGARHSEGEQKGIAGQEDPTRRPVSANTMPIATSSAIGPRTRRKGVKAAIMT